MTEEGRVGEPMDEVEVAHGMANLAMAVRALYVGMVEEGFTPSEALRLCAAYMGGLSGGGAR